MAHIADHLSVVELGLRARTSDDACAAGRVAKILAGEECASGRGIPRSDGEISGTPIRLIDPVEAAEQAASRHRNVRFGEDYFDR